MKKILILVNILVFVFLISNGVKAAAADNVYSWAWSENIGWISFNCDNPELPAPRCTNNYGVNIDSSTGLFSGYAWSENIGWIQLNPAGPYPGAPNYSACLDLPGSGQTCDGVGDYKVSGWARALAYDNSWDGWIKLRKAATDGGTDYGVTLNNSTKEFQGWAWGSDVIGWISFNCLDRGVCGSSPYKIYTSLSLNQQPDKPLPANGGEIWDHCSIQGLSMPTFRWTYSDPDDVPAGTDPQSAFELQTDNSGNPYNENTGFASPLFSYLADPSSSLLFTPAPAQLGWMNWNSSYDWIVRVKDSKGSWSKWSAPNPFTTPAHAYPWPMFAPVPSRAAIGERVNFIQDTPIPATTATSSAICYNAAGNKYLCQTGSTPPISYGWDFNMADGFNPVYPGGSTKKGNASTTYSTIPPGSTYTVRLQITDDVGTCSKDKIVTVTYPLPKWKEIPPFSWLPNLPSLADILETPILGDIVKGVREVLAFFDHVGL